MVKKNVLILQGIPGSGKSTWAKKFVTTRKRYKNWVIISRDGIRKMCGKYWYIKREDLISDIELLSIVSSLDFEYNVIIDATNVNAVNLYSIKDFLETKYNNNPDSELKVVIKYKLFEISPLNAYIRVLRRYLTGGIYTSFSVIKHFKVKLDLYKSQNIFKND
jgi:broad-specificity NMP kinase